MDPHSKDTLDRLRAITDGCRADMHEPDNQGLACRVLGDHLDNAMGDSVQEVMIVGGYQEFVVVLERLRGDQIAYEKFNLADLIALARLATVDDERARMIAAFEVIAALDNRSKDDCFGLLKRARHIAKCMLQAVKGGA